MKVPFTTIWKKQGKEYTNAVAIRVTGISAEPGAISWNKGSSFGGIDWSLFVGKDIDVETDGEYFVIKGIYQ